MNFGKLFTDTVRIRVICADIPNAFQRMTIENTPVFDVVEESDISFVFTVKNKDISHVKKILYKIGAECELLDSWGIGCILYRLRSRGVLLCSIIALLCLTVWIPSRIFFICVEGNQRIPDRMIVQTAETLGVDFGSKRTELRSETIKNLMIEVIPELDWVGITTAGCVATIEVRENAEKDEDTLLNEGSIVAGCDGIVKTVTVTKGKTLCQPGEVVQKGQILISGYEDCGLIIKYSGAEGEVIADTFRIVQMKSPRILLQRQQCDQIKRTVSLRIGKKLINFVKDSGISPAGCDKMYSEKILTLPGGFILPIAVIQETYSYYSTEPISLPEDSCSWLAHSADYYLRKQMMAGEILSGNVRTDYTDDLIVFRGEYFCSEQIGKYKFEEIPNYGKNS